MKKRTLKRIALTVVSVFVFLVVVLAVHIYMVTRPRVDARTRVMARIDIKQQITGEDAGRISDWLSQQKGVDHVVVNPKSDIAIFTYSPLQNDANQITRDFNASLPYKGQRFLPAAGDMKAGCPVASTSITYKVYTFMKHIF